MKDYLKKFEAIGNYNTWKASENYIEPNVSLIDENTVEYNPIPDYSKMYLTFEAIQDTTFTFSTNALQYSLDNGATWTTLAAGTASPTVTAGNKILWKQTGLIPGTVRPNQGIGTFSTIGNFNVSGNIMSLYYGDDFIGQTSLLGKTYAFYKLFYNNTKLVSAENLILPATTLANSCYYSMFEGCTALTITPELPAITLTSYCYPQMFWGCTSLTTAPELPATTLSEYCYSYMFYNCTSLTSAPEILPATTLADFCYNYMFSGCSSLTTAPELPATTLTQYCYNCMFTDCTLLNYIKCLAINISASSCTYRWISGVAATGTFVKAASTNWSSKTGVSGIPSGWTVQDAA